MRKTLLLAGVATIFTISNAVAMEINPYVSAKMKYVDMSADYDEPGYSLSADDNVLGGAVAFGAEHKTSVGTVRTEVEYNRNQDTEKKLFSGLAKAEVESQSLMFNAYYDIDTNSKFTPYVGAGVGYAKIKGKLKSPVLSDDMSDTNFAWQVGAGVGYELTENVTMDAGYRYADYGDFSEYDSKLDVSAHEFYVGARYTF